MSGATISGTVAAPGGANNAGVCVYALAVGGQLAGRNVTDEMGSYAIPNLAAGSYKVIFDPSCGGSQISYFSSRQYRRTVSVAPGQAFTGLNGTLTLRSAQAFHRVYLATRRQGLLVLFRRPVGGRAEH